MKDSLPSIKRPLVTFIKVSYYEILSIILLSGVFWMCVFPVFTTGSALLSLFKITKDIYNGTAPNTELKRIKYFLQLVRANFIRGLPLSIFAIFIAMNTIWYFIIVLSGQAFYYIVGGIVGIYLCFLSSLLFIRVLNISGDNEGGWRSGIQLAISASVRYPSFSSIQIIIMGLGIITSIVFPIGLLFLLPGGLMMFELIFYEELMDSNPQKVLNRYETGI